MSHRTTFSDLTSEAALRLSHALTDIASPGAADDGITGPADDGITGPAAALVAHQDLTAALAHLGRTLTTPPGADASDGADAASARRAGPRRTDARLVRLLDQRGVRRDWASPHAPPGSATASLLTAGQLIRAAADLWATHHTPGGAPRSPQASRMRHPSMLGAATREWRELVLLAGAVAEALVGWMERVGNRHPHDDGREGPDRLAAVRDYPRPIARAVAAGAPTRVDLTVARPGRIRGADPLAEVADRVERLHRFAWALAQSEEAPAPALVTIAAIGTLLSGAAATAHVRAAQGAQPGADRDEHRVAADCGRRAERQWSVVASRVWPLRTPHPATTTLQIERLDLVRLLNKVLSSTDPQDLAMTAAALSRAVLRCGEVAELNLRALRAAHERGDVYLMGRALPAEALGRRPDLLQAKLADRPVPAPTAMVRRVEAAYRAVSTSASTLAAGDGVPAA